MKATLDCLECLASQALRAARVATDDLATQREILNRVVAKIPTLDLDTSPGELSLIIYETVRAVTGIADPYRDIKRAQNEAALEFEPELRAMVAAADDPLVAALYLSAAGNIIDLGVRHAGGIDVRATVDEVMREGFAVDHTAALRESLARAKDLIFLLDNAGEIVFDKILIEELLKHARVTAVVKAAPILNDVLYEDAEQVGLTALCDVIDNGGAFIGSPLGLVPPSFVERLRRADMRIGKGQGNYETLDEFPGDVFLILRAKCEAIAKHMGVKYGQVALISTRMRPCSALRSLRGKIHWEGDLDATRRV